MSPTNMKTVSLFTDGACRGNPGPGGWGAILRHAENNKELSGFEPNTTNNRMELTAVIEGVKQLKEPCAVTIVTDSQYVKNGIEQWVKKWRTNGWKTANKKPVKNVDLWQKLGDQVEKHETKWQWVRGHSGHPENERCDELANRAIDRNN